MKKIKSVTKKIVEKIKKVVARMKRIAGYIVKPMMQWVKDGNFRARVRYAGYYKRLPIREKTVLYESFLGRGMACNPYAIFRELLHDDYYKEYVHIWVINEIELHAQSISEYRQYSNVKFVVLHSREHLKWLASAQYLISNNSLPPHYIKKPGQTYINTWHGVPLKKIGFDLYDGADITKNVGRSFLQTDYMISDNAFLSEKYINSFKLREAYEGKILEEGYPRVDLLFSNKSDVIEKLENRGVKIDRNKEIILYAPTWRGTNFNNLADGVEEILEFKSKLEALIDTSKYQVLIKPHTLLQKMFSELKNMDYIIPASFDANEALSVVDILIGDFSSLYFDFMVLNRPILFYITDSEEYKNTMGVYFSLDDLPAPYTDTVEEIAQWVGHINEFTQENKERYAKARKLLENADVKNISGKVSDIIFKGATPQNEVCHKSGKTKLLIYKGPSLMNGISISLTNLLKNIDYEKYDVTVYVYRSKNIQETNYLESIPSNCRVMVRVGDFSVTLLERIFATLSNEYGYSYQKKFYPATDLLYKREVLRSFGSAKFDYVIQFEGYSRFLSLMALATPAKKRYIWQHNDMHNEFELKYKWLRHLFSAYPYFDGIVGCAEATMEVNRKNLATPETYGKFTHSTNFFDATRVSELLDVAKYVTLNHREYYQTESSSNKTLLVPLEMSQEQSSENEVFLCNKTWKNGIQEVKLTENEKTVRFITIGRSSPEKNHRALFDGFEQLLKEYPNCMLYIVGAGPSFQAEYSYVLKKNLENHIIMTHNLKNPFGLMRKCDCFIFPSLHEGQGLVVLEARMLNLPIILSDYDVVSSVSQENGQLIIGKTKDEIYNGMKAFLNGEVPCDYNFDPAEYNQKCYQEFEALFDD